MILFNRLTPKLARTCRENMITFCQLPKDWSMNEELNDVQLGMYLGCLYQHRQQVFKIKHETNVFFIFMLLFSLIVIVVVN